MHQVPLLISESSPIRPNFKLLKGSVNTRSSQAQPLYKIVKLVATGGPFKPELSILESCCASRYGKGQGCLLTKFWSLESRAQGGGKHINRVQFLELFPESACEGFLVKKQPLYYIFTPSHLLI